MHLTVPEIITLSCLFGIGSKKLYRVADLPSGDLLSRINACGLTLREEGKTVEVSTHHLEEASVRAEKIIRASEEQGVTLISYQDENYPEILRHTINEKGDWAPPLLLYAMGDVNTLSMPCITIAGTRHPSPEGAKAARYLAEGFVREGFCIVSGLANGCDTAAHEGALVAGGKTVAFLAHGLHMVVPAENRLLAARIVEQGGLLLSEYPWGMAFSKYSFIARDRLQAGLSKATIVVQSDVKGGSMHVAHATLKANKPLYTLYFDDEETRALPISAGNAYLAQKGARYLKGGDDLHIVSSAILTQPICPYSLF